MSNIDDDAQKFDNLNVPSDGMPDPTVPDPTAQPPMAAAIGDSFQDVVDDDDLDKPVVKTDGLGTKVMRASPYAVMLAISVVAIGVALLCLILEWGTYGYQRKPKNLTMSPVENARFLAISMPESAGNSLGQDAPCI